jgi:2-oxoglutarate ferredoxin oxidoreductase subunit alpha
VIEQNRDAQMLSLLKLDLPAADIGKLRSVLHFDGLPIDARFVTDKLVLQEEI